MDELLNDYARAATAYGGTVQELKLLAQSRHTRSAYLNALQQVEKARQTCDQAHTAFHEPAERTPRPHRD